MFLDKIKQYIIKKIIIIKWWFLLQRRLIEKSYLTKKVKKIIIKNNNWLSEKDIEFEYEKDENNNITGIVAIVKMPQFEFEIEDDK